MSDHVLDVENVRVSYGKKGFRRTPKEVLHGVSLHIDHAETVGLVGESGSGKTTLGRAILGLIPVSDGQITYAGKDITDRSMADRRRLATKIQVVFQDPYSSLNPSLTVGGTLSEPLRATGFSRAEADRRVRALLDRVGLPSNAVDRLPREFSGGQRQRIAIARALALGPELIVCDEPVSSLDMTTQVKILDLLIEIQNETGVACLFISHDISVVRYISHRVAVMLRGDIVEEGTAEAVTERPQHPYSKRLMLSSPVTNPVEQMIRREELAAMVAGEGALAARGA
jgi:ABC-type glutathione transport system ATPase component